MRGLLWLAVWLLLSSWAAEHDRRDLAAQGYGTWSVAAAYGPLAERELYGEHE